VEKEKIRPRGPFGKKKQLELDMAQLSQEMYKRNLELAETNQILSLLRTIDNLVLESHDELEVLCQNITKSIIEHSPYPLVAILAIPPSRDYLELMASASSYDSNPNIEGYKVKMDDHDEWFVNPDRTAIVDLSTISDKDIARILHDSQEDVVAMRHNIPVQTIVLVKLLARHRLVGLMVVGFTQHKQTLSEKDLLLLNRVSEVVGIALDNKLLSEENQHVLRQLQKSNQKLKALDQTKDEFISMASHQLRTPLTSVKGYLSMVLEGDAGDITEMQRKLLGQAFASSQRMVYLIADLLNVSRLQTGKFTIEPSAVNLAEVTESEIKQLQDTANARELTLNFKKPDNFPILMLDETKLRQVIMNFTDNAIYYTPAGGIISVELKETENTIDFTVTDNGIGVPEGERHHLFTKFYRAGNAKKARPDGTGLGLFMCKKVIVAQGGSLIFQTQEGKGSTFGFSFEKSKLLPNPPIAAK
jgi:signal transduction histidine kinase